MEQSVTGLVQDTQYNIWVKAVVDGTNVTATSDPLVVTTRSQVLGVRSDTLPTFDAIKLAWESINNAEYYTVYWSTGDDKATASKKIAASTSISETLNDLTSGSTYNIWVDAKLKGIAALQKEEKITVATKTLAAPVVSGIRTTMTSIILDWTSIPTVDGLVYDVYWADDVYNVSGKILDHSTTAYTINGLEEATEYNVWVEAIIDDTTAKSLSIKTTETKMQKPVLTLTTFAVSETTTVTIEWPKVPNAVKYDVYYTNSLNNLRRKAGDTSAVTDTITYKLDGLIPGDSYTIRVEAISETGAVTFGTDTLRTWLATPTATASTPTNFITAGASTMLKLTPSVCTSVTYEYIVQTSSAGAPTTAGTPIALNAWIWNDDRTASFEIDLGSMAKGNYKIYVRAVNTTNATSRYQEILITVPAAIADPAL